MLKKYDNPMLHVVSINRKDIIVTSPVAGYDPTATLSSESNIGAAGRRFDSWNEGF